MMDYGQFPAFLPKSGQFLLEGAIIEVILRPGRMRLDPKFVQENDFVFPLWRGFDLPPRKDLSGDHQGGEYDDDADNIGRFHSPVLSEITWVFYLTYP